ncbi:MAG: hypothetical protein II190_03840, partial [Ruminococcus sp.]|nr:hypothetical protein [Ruminococcus sp.]
FIDPQSSDSPVLVEDHLAIDTDAGQCVVTLQAYGQDVRILRDLHITSDSTLTAGKPYVRLFGEIYHSYAVTLPEIFEKLKPDGLSAEYFGSALYTLCGFYQLGSLVPLSCYGETGGQTVKSLAENI